MTKKVKKMPSNVKVGYFDYDIKEDSNLIEALGQTKLDKLTIQIDPNYPEQIIKETLLHECLHAVLRGTYIVSDETEEKLVSIMSPALMLLVKDNPDLKKYLFD